MKPLRMLLLIVMQGLLLVEGLYYFCYDRLWFQENLRGLIPEVGSHGWTAIWVACLVVPMLYWLVALCSIRGKERVLEIRTASGDMIRYQFGAIEEYVRSLVRTHPGVSSHQVQVNQGADEAVSIRLSIKVKPIQSVPEIHRQ